jgi:hypothetical protein
LPRLLAGLLLLAVLAGLLAVLALLSGLTTLLVLLVHIVTHENFLLAKHVAKHRAAPHLENLSTSEH